MGEAAIEIEAVLTIQIADGPHGFRQQMKRASGMEDRWTIQDSSIKQ